jgi:predicted CDP-diglyceride synthetase/phosphatidate cytidylyltransferase
MKRLHGKTFKPGYNFDPGLKRLPCNHALDLNIDAWNTYQTFTLLILIHICNFIAFREFLQRLKNRYPNHYPSFVQPGRWYNRPLKSNYYCLAASSYTSQSFVVLF